MGSPDSTGVAQVRKGTVVTVASRRESEETIMFSTDSMQVMGSRSSTENIEEEHGESEAGLMRVIDIAEHQPIRATTS